MHEKGKAHYYGDSGYNQAYIPLFDGLFDFFQFVRRFSVWWRSRNVQLYSVCFQKVLGDQLVFFELLLDICFFLFRCGSLLKALKGGFKIHIRFPPMLFLV